MLGGNSPSIWGSGEGGRQKYRGYWPIKLWNLHRQMQVRQVCWGKMGGLETKETQDLG